MNRIFTTISMILLQKLEKSAHLLILFPLFMLYYGTTGLINEGIEYNPYDYDSSDLLICLTSIDVSFILAGALGITFIVWLVTRKYW